MCPNPNGSTGPKPVPSLCIPNITPNKTLCFEAEVLNIIKCSSGKLTTTISVLCERNKLN